MQCLSFLNINSRCFGIIVCRMSKSRTKNHMQYIGVCDNGAVNNTYGYIYRPIYINANR